MLLDEYLAKHGLLKKHRAKVHDAVDNGSTFTVLYRIEGQKYKHEKDFSARTLTRAQYDATQVDDDGYILTGKTYRKSNFWIWEPSESDDEA